MTARKHAAADWQRRSFCMAIIAAYGWASPGFVQAAAPPPTSQPMADAQSLAQRAALIAKATPELGQIRADIAQLNEHIAQRAKEGKFVDVARVYAAALTWSADDIQRCLDADELPIVRQANSLLADLRKAIADPGRVLAHISDQAPNEADPFHASQNPYFKAVVDAARGQSRRETTYLKGRKGYVAIPNPWTFRSFGDSVYDQVWSITAPQSPLRNNPIALANALNLLDAIAHQHTGGDFNVDRKSPTGRDGNINRFCLAPALDAWWRLRQEYPNLLPPAKEADLQAELKQLVDFQLSDYGLARVTHDSFEKHPGYANMDVHHILIMEFAHRLWGDEQYAKEVEAFVKILKSAVYPRGAFAYINTQNECFVYHHLDVVYSARFWQLTGNPITLDMLRGTTNYYPYNVEPAGMPEYYTDACWKHYWGGGGPWGPEVIASLCNDPLNKRVADTCGGIWGYGHGYMTAITAEFFKPMASAPLPDGYVFDDADIAGPRGRYGTWSFAGNGRNYGVGYQGKDTFVGCMITDPARRPNPLDAALQVVTAEVRLNLTDNHWTGARCCSALEKLSTTLGPDFGSLAVNYTLSRPNWGHKADELIPWTGQQEWYLSKTRLVGLVAIEAADDVSSAGVWGRIRLGVSRTLEADGDHAWKYGKLRIKIHASNYARFESRPSENFFRDLPKDYHSTEITLIDPRSAAPNQKGHVTYPRGTRYWFLVEIFPDSSTPAEEVTRIDSGAIRGFSFRESGRWAAVLHNASDRAGAIPVAGPAGVGKVIRYDTPEGKGAVLDAFPAQVDVPAGKHLVLTGAWDKQP